MSRHVEFVRQPGEPKGSVRRRLKEAKRREAEVRQANADPRRSKAARLGSTFNPKTGKRESWDRDQFAHHHVTHLERVKQYTVSN